MTGSVRVIEDDTQFQPELTSAGQNLVVIDFFATWCGPCVRISPVFQQLAAKFPKAVFLKVDVDKCRETAASQGVTAMPTFIFYKNKVKVDTMRGADPVALEAKIQKLYSASAEEGEDQGVKGHLDLSTFIDKSGCECLNQSDEHTFEHCLVSKGGYLESDVDEQMLLTISFIQNVKIHSMKIEGPPDKGPKTVKLFINQPGSLGFDQAERMNPTQMIELSLDDLKPNVVIPLRFVKFQNVNNITIFFQDNQGKTETTQVDYVCLIGSAVTTTTMSDFKRVAGKKGEAH